MLFHSKYTRLIKFRDVLLPRPSMLTGINMLTEHMRFSQSDTSTLGDIEMSLDAFADVGTRKLDRLTEGGKLLEKTMSDLSSK